MKSRNLILALLSLFFFVAAAVYSGAAGHCLYSHGATGTRAADAGAVHRAGRGAGAGDWAGGDRQIAALPRAGGAFSKPLSGGT